MILNTMDVYCTVPAYFLIKTDAQVVVVMSVGQRTTRWCLEKLGWRRETEQESCTSIFIFYDGYECRYELFFFIAAIYVNDTIDGCGLWLPEDLQLFSEEFGKNQCVSLYLNKTTYGKGSTIFKKHTYFFPQNQEQFTTKILNYINKPKCSNYKNILVC